MNCPEQFEYLQKYLDCKQARDWPFELEQHLAGCASCRNLFQAARVLESGLKGLPFPEAAPDLSGRIVAGVLADRKMRLLRRRVYVGLAAAAAVLLALMPLLNGFFTPAPDNNTVTPVVVHDPAPPRNKVTPAKENDKVKPNELSPSLGRQMDEVRSTVAALAGGTKERASSWIHSAAELAPAKNAANMTDPMLDAGQPLLETGSVVSVGLQPVADSAQRAVGYFAREFPLLKGG
jgi:hypothetical protein